MSAVAAEGDSHSDEQPTTIDRSRHFEYVVPLALPTLIICLTAFLIGIGTGAVNLQVLYDAFHHHYGPSK